MYMLHYLYLKKNKSKNYFFNTLNTLFYDLTLHPQFTASKYIKILEYFNNYWVIF